ncbi:hypothetical protein ACJX0J_015208, partial [Zea mays]
MFIDNPLVQAPIDACHFRAYLLVLLLDPITKECLLALALVFCTTHADIFLIIFYPVSQLFHALYIYWENGNTKTYNIALDYIILSNFMLYPILRSNTFHIKKKVHMVAKQGMYILIARFVIKKRLHS